MRGSSGSIRIDSWPTKGRQAWVSFFNQIYMILSIHTYIQPSIHIALLLLHLKSDYLTYCNPSYCPLDNRWPLADVCYSILTLVVYWYLYYQQPQMVGSMTCWTRGDRNSLWRRYSRRRWREAYHVISFRNTKEVCSSLFGWTISVETFVVKDPSSHLNRPLAKFGSLFIRFILTGYLRAWRLRISLAASTLL